MGIDARMFVRTTATVDEKWLKHAAWLMCAVFGRSNFWVDRTRDRRALEIVPEWGQDGDTITPELGETFISVSLGGRYWGPGYERGDLAFIVTIAEWLERVFPGSQVWYGGDSSGVCAEHFSARKRAEFLDHAASDRGADYFTRESSQRCDWCDEPMSECRWGSAGTGSTCRGCGLYRLVTDTRTSEAIGHWPDEQGTVSS